MLTLVLLSFAAAHPTSSAAAAACPSSRSDLDLNGDGYDDAVVGDPYATVSGHAGAGAVVVLYGDADCRIGEGARRVVTQSTAGIPGTAEAGDHFGWSVAVDDLTGDGRADILVGSPGEGVGSRASAGAVHVISFAAGSPAGAVTAVSLTQDTLGRTAEAGDQFGFTVAGADAGGDEAGSLAAAGAPGEDLLGVSDAGVVDAFGFDGSWRLNAEFQQGQGGGSPLSVGVPGVPQAGDRFGAALLIAQLNAPFTGDVLAGPEPTYVMGAPGDVVAGHDNAGSVTLAYTQTNGLEQVTQDSSTVTDHAETGDAFGSSLAVHETRSWRDDETRTLPRRLAVGSPGEDVGSVVDGGSVTLFRSEVDGLEALALFTQDTTGFPGRTERGDHFGASVAMRPQPGGSDGVLLIGVPDEDLGSVVDAGMVQTVDVTASGTEVGPSYTEASAATPGAPAAGNRFGLTVAAMQGRAETLWAIASPYHGSGSVFLSSSSGEERAWVPGSGGVPRLAGSGRFGWSVSGLESEG